MAQHQQPNQEQPPQSELDIEIAKLEKELSTVLKAEEFFSTGAGQLITQLFTTEITRLTREVTSDKYRKDHLGYNNALSDLHSYQNILKRLQLAASPIRKAKIQEAREALQESL